MANLLIATGTSYSPLLALGPEDWVHYCKGDLKRKFNKRDGTLLTYEQLRTENGDKYAAQATLDEFRRLSRMAQGCLNRIAAELVQLDPDVVVVVADDHSELFDTTNMPVISVYRGAELFNSPGDRRTAQYLDKEEEQTQWRRAIEAVRAIAPERHYPGHPVFADSLAEGLIGQSVDVAVATEPKAPTEAGIGFAWGFVINRVLGERKIPVVPVVLNPRYAPNVPTPGRCCQIGHALYKAILESKEPLRVAVICAGGLSHLGIDEELDRSTLEAVRTHDVASLSNLPREALVSGNCQLLNWAVLAGVAHDLENAWLQYLPVYRTAAGTGIGLAFGSWVTNRNR